MIVHEYFVSFFSIDAMGLPHFASLGLQFTRRIALEDIPGVGAHVRDTYIRETGRATDGFALLGINLLGEREVADQPDVGSRLVVNGDASPGPSPGTPPSNTNPPRVH